MDKEMPVEARPGSDPRYQKGYHAGYSQGYASALEQIRRGEPYNASAWETALRARYPHAGSQFAAGYREGFLQTYNESWADS